MNKNKKIWCLMISSALLLTTPVSAWATNSAVGPGIAAVVESNDFLHLDTTNPVVKPVQNYTYDQMEADIQALKSRYGEKLQVNVIGTSLDGRNIYDIVLGKPDGKKQILIQGSIHGREHITSLLMMSQIEYALAYYDSGHYNGRLISDMFKKATIHFIPMSNPDGVTISQLGLNGLRAEELRQTVLAAYDADRARGRTSAFLESYLTRWKSNARGVDLNSNFETGWNEIQNGITSAAYANYKGPSVLSEPESQALANIGNQRDWSAVISYHAQGEIIYWDSGDSGARMASKTLVESLKAMTGYSLDNSLGKGGYKDWMQSKSDSCPSVTIEVGHTPCPVPVNEFPAIWKQNKGVWVQTMDYVIRRN